MIGDTYYQRRCQDCGKRDGFDNAARYRLPPLDKKFIYLDQSAISDMMKALNPAMSANKKGKVDPYWYELFCKLDRLCKIQLLVCPNSVYHEMESVLSEDFEAYQRMYHQLSCGVTFINPDTMQIHQLLDHASAWILKQSPSSILDRSRVVHGKINAWLDKFVVYPNRARSLDDVEMIRQLKLDIHSGQSEVFQRWQTDISKEFDDWFHEECKGYGVGLMAGYEKYILQFKEAILFPDEKAIDNLIPPPAYMIIQAIRKRFEEAGVPNERSLIATTDFLSISEICEVPFIRITALFYAAIAYRAAKTGKKIQPGQGMWLDISSISMSLPYCDAIFVDNECHSILSEKHVAEKLPFSTQIFSRSNKEDFMVYLDSIEAQATANHLAAVNEVYGDDWPTPYTSMYLDNSSA